MQWNLARVIVVRALLGSYDMYIGTALGELRAERATSDGLSLFPAGSTNKLMKYENIKNEEDRNLLAPSSFVLG